MGTTVQLRTVHVHRNMRQMTVHFRRTMDPSSASDFDGRMVDLRLLHTFRVLHTHGTVTAAAAALHLSPSAVSQQLRRLSQQAGAELLRAEGRRLRLTAAGEVLLAHADTLWAQWEQARADLADEQASAHRVLRLGAFATGIVSLVAPVARRLPQQLPPTPTRLVEVDAADCYRGLLAGSLDIAVLAPLPDSPPADDPRFEQAPLYDDFIDLVVPADHRLAGAGRIDLAQAATEEWIAPHHDQGRLNEAICAAAGFTPRLVHQADAWQAVLALIAEGLGICLVPRLLPLDADLGLRRVPLHGSPPPLRRVLTCVRRGSGAQPSVARGLDALRTRAAELTRA